jgi:hypothetical protein
LISPGHACAGQATGPRPLSPSNPDVNHRIIEAMLASGELLPMLKVAAA